MEQRVEQVLFTTAQKSIQGFLDEGWIVQSMASDGYRVLLILQRANQLSEIPDEDDYYEQEIEPRVPSKSIADYAFELTKRMDKVSLAEKLRSADEYVTSRDYSILLGDDDL